MVIEKKIKASKIIELYKRELDIDVSKYFVSVSYVYLCRCIKSDIAIYLADNLKPIFGLEDLYDKLKEQLPKLYKTKYYVDEKWEYNLAVNAIENGSKVFEIGSGIGTFIEKISRTNGVSAIGCELNSDAVEQAKNKGLDVRLLNIKDAPDEMKEAFDVVCAFQVLEHVENIHDFIRDALSLLRRNGKFMIAVPYSNPYLFKNDLFNVLNLPPHHLSLWNEKSFFFLETTFPLKLVDYKIQTLAEYGYDFDRYCEVNTPLSFRINLPFESTLERFFRKYVRSTIKHRRGKNIFVVFEKL